MKLTAKKAKALAVNFEDPIINSEKDAEKYIKTMSKLGFQNTRLVFNELSKYTKLLVSLKLAGYKCFIDDELNIDGFYIVDIEW